MRVDIISLPALRPVNPLGRFSSQLMSRELSCRVGGPSLFIPSHTSSYPVSYFLITKFIPPHTHSHTSSYSKSHFLIPSLIPPHYQSHTSSYLKSCLLVPTHIPAEGSSKLCQALLSKNIKINE